MNQQEPNSQTAAQQAAPQPSSSAPAGTSPAPQAAGRSGLAVAALVLGIVGLAISWMPIINNLAFIVALVGLILGIVGIVGCSRKGKGGKGLAIAGVVLSVVTCVVVLATQAAYSAAIDEAVSNTRVEVTADGSASQDAAGTEGTTDLAVGQSATVGNGLTVSVDEVTADVEKYDGSAATRIMVTYVNNGSKEASFNPYDWKGQDLAGAQRSQTFVGMDEGGDELQSGTLAPGGTVTGAVYFDGEIAKALYYANMLSNSPTASWVI